MERNFNCMRHPTIQPRNTMNIRSMSAPRAGLLSLLIAMGSNASAAVIFDNGDIFPIVDGANFSEGSGRLGDDFSLSGAETVRSVQFWGTRWQSGVQPANDQFFIAIYNRVGNTVGSVVGSSNLSLVSKIDTGFDHNNSANADILEYTMDLSSVIALAAGDYLLSVWSADDPGTNFAWQRSSSSGTSFRSSTSGASWVTGGAGDNAWNISNTFAGAGGAVPEPASLALAALALLGVGLTRTRKST
jgi:PEP-CTERM motif